MNATSAPLFSTNRLFTHVVITFTVSLTHTHTHTHTLSVQPPELCPEQEGSYILSFDDGDEGVWSRSPVEMEGHGLVTVILGTAEEPRLKRERNYTLRVTIVTEYTNISSTTEFSEEKQTSS